MALTGQAKVDYQREYMRRRRSNTIGSFVRPTASSVRPKLEHDRPPGITDSVWNYMKMKREQESR